MASVLEFDARINQKTDTLVNWNNNPLKLNAGECAWVVGATGTPINFKIGDGTKTFAELPFWIQYDQGAYIAYTATPSIPVAYTVVGAGTYGSITVATAKLAVLSWNGTAWFKNYEGDLPSVDVVDDLTSTSSTEALSANQGRILSEGQNVETFGTKIGVENPELTAPLTVVNTRLSPLVIATSGLIKVNAEYPASGTGKLKRFKKNGDGTYNFIGEIDITPVSGLNSFEIDVLSGEQLAFFGTVNPCGVSATGGSSFTLPNNNTGVNQTASASNFILQFNYQYVTTEPLKEVVSDLSANLDSRYANSIIDVKDANTLTVSKSYTDSSIVNYNILDTVSVSGTNGVATLASGITSGNSRTRINNEPFGGSFDAINISSLEFNCFQAGSIKIIICTKSSSDVFTSVKSVTKTCTVGLNTLTSTELTALSGLASGNYYVAFYMTSTSSVESINQPTPKGWFVTSDITSAPATSMGTSTLQIQFKMSFTGVKNYTVKSKLTELDKTKGKVIYVTKTGNDTTGTGAKGASYLTINKAISESIGSANVKIIIGGGDYRETLDFSALTFENINFVKNQREVVRVLGSSQLSGFTKTSGYTNIYQASYSGTVATWTRAKNPIFEDGNSSRLIDISERNPLQRGLANRLPFTPIPAIDFNTDLATTLTTLDGTAGRYYYDSANSLLYIHASLSTNPSTNGFTYEVPMRDANIAPSVTVLDTRPNLLLDNIQFMFLKRGFSANGFEKVYRNRCTIMAVAGDGIVAGGWRDDTSQVYSYKDEVAFCDGDGVNGHYNIYSGYTTLGLREGAGLCEYIDLWTHDNLDDGMSHHERHDVTVIGGLSEYNGDRGFVPAQGCQMTAYNAISRKNGQDPLEPSSGEGFAVVNEVLDGRNGTILLAYNCISEGNRRGYVARDDVKNLLIAVGCVSRNNLTTEYSASYGNILAKNCKVTNADSSKYKVTTNGGVITVQNDSDLT